MKQELLEYGNQVVAYLHIKSILKPLYYRLYKSKLLEKQKELFHKNANEALRKFNSCMQRHDIPYTLAFGTMLGAVREHGFIKHDIDIDIMMWNENYSQKIPSLLERHGFNRTHEFLVEDGMLGREESYDYKGVQIDIFFMYESGERPTYCCDFMKRGCMTYEACMKKYGNVLPRRLELPVSKQSKMVQFEDMELPIPINAEEILAFRYGDDFMTPNPDWGVQSHNNHIVEWGEKQGVFNCYL